MQVQNNKDNTPKIVMARTPKNEADRAVHVTVSVPRHIKDKMTEFNYHVNWSSVAKAAFEVELAKLALNPPAPPVVADAATPVSEPAVETPGTPAVDLEAAGLPTEVAPPVTDDVFTIEETPVEAPVVDSTPAVEEAPVAVEAAPVPTVVPAEATIAEDIVAPAPIVEAHAHHSHKHHAPVEAEAKKA